MSTLAPAALIPRERPRPGQSSDFKTLDRRNQGFGDVDLQRASRGYILGIHLVEWRVFCWSRDRENCVMSLCPGKQANGQLCHQIVYRRTNCGTVGCDTRPCSNQNFSLGGECKSCGKSGGVKKPV
jgi:hypothetical protein